LCRELPEGVTEKNHIGRPYKISKFIDNHHIIDLGNRHLEVIRTPGHTPDSILLIDRKNKLMWTGDSYYSGPIWLFAAETNLQDYQHSLEIMISESHGIKWLLPAHNTPLVNPDVLVKVLKLFNDIIATKVKPISLGDDMLEYKSTSDLPFSFILGNEQLPDQ
jgi:glyoxylase-like metal-dependent hydrolase (beta-lactamase superfamily II)